MGRHQALRLRPRSGWGTEKRRPLPGGVHLNGLRQVGGRNLRRAATAYRLGVIRRNGKETRIEAANFTGEAARGEVNSKR
jgi:hypothetical protein